MFYRMFLKRILIVVFLSVTSISAQNVTIRRGARMPKQEASTQTLNLSRRAINQGLDLKKNKDYHRWEKVVYRFLDLNNPENAVLYYIGNNTKRENLFARIFKLLNNHEIKAYDYLDGVELYDKEHELDFKAFLERFQIPFQAKTTRRGLKTQSIEVDDNNIPSLEVLAYYVKEVWYFDQAKSEFDVSIEAICPILFSSGDYKDMTYPLFWLPYDQLRPYINLDLVVLNDSNNIAEATMDDFFTMRMYKGDIVKVQNLLNKSLIQQAGTDSLKVKRDSIEQVLKQMQVSSFATPALMKLKAENLEEKQNDSVSRGNSRDRRIKKSRKTAKKTKAKKAVTKQIRSKSVRGRF